jgi:hypothetical protein
MTYFEQMELIGPTTKSTREFIISILKAYKFIELLGKSSD